MPLKASALPERLQHFRNIEMDTISASISKCSVREMKRAPLRISPQEERSGRNCASG